MKNNQSTVSNADREIPTLGSTDNAGNSLDIVSGIILLPSGRGFSVCIGANDRFYLFYSYNFSIPKVYDGDFSDENALIRTFYKTNVPYLTQSTTNIIRVRFKKFEFETGVFAATYTFVNGKNAHIAKKKPDCFAIS